LARDDETICVKLPNVVIAVESVPLQTAYRLGVSVMPVGAVALIAMYGVMFTYAIDRDAF
jgi:hypothetical protein